MIIDLQKLPVPERQSWLQHAIAPRPVCLASTIDLQGNINLSPFSFFNLFSANPPVIVFSPALRVRDNTTKHTLENLREIPELVVNIVDEEMVQQVSLASCDYPKEVNEFEKAGFTSVASDLVRPPRVAESKIQFECKVLDIQSLGEGPGAGNLVISEILRMHVAEEIIGENAMIDQTKIHHIARLGGDWYCRVGPENLFRVAKPNTKLGIGIDKLPAAIRNSQVLTGNHLGRLANVNELPTTDPAFEEPRLREIFQYYSANPDDMEKEIHLLAQALLDEGKLDQAWQVLLSYT